MEGLRARPVKLPKPGLALEHLPTGLTHTKGRKSTHSQRKLKLAKRAVATRSTSFCPELPAPFLSALVPHGELVAPSLSVLSTAAAVKVTAIT